MSLAQIRLLTQNTLFLNAFDVWRLRGIASALRLAMLTKNEKLTNSGLADTSASENTLFSMKLYTCCNQSCGLRSKFKKL